MYPVSLAKAVILVMSTLLITACKEKAVIFPAVMHAPTRGYCGSCHMAYQPSMLPAASWRVMMERLDDHFDEKISLKATAKKDITRYLIANAGDVEKIGDPGRIALDGLQKNARLQRITQTPYFLKEHRFLENRILEEWVGSVANCPACHVGAWVGDYRS